jgi:integrase
MGVMTNGYVQKRAKSWYVYYREDGKKRGKVVKGARNKTEAERYLKTEIFGNNVEHLHRGNIRFSDFAVKWIENKQPYLKPSVYDRYVLNLQKHIIPFFREKKLNSIHSGPIQAFVKHLSQKKSGKYKNPRSKDVKTLAPKTVNNNLMILSSLFSDALDDRMIDENPVQIKKHKLTVNNEEADYFTVQEIQAFLSNVRAELYPFFFLLWNSGLRVNEATALKWSAIDFENKLIRITKSIYRRYGSDVVDNLLETEPKSNAGLRTVPLTPQLEKILLETRRDKNVQGIDGYIFERKVRRFSKDEFRYEPYIADGIVRSEFRRALGKAGLRETLKVHSIRHGYITIVRQHLPEWLARRIIGHYTPNTTDLYTHINLKDYAATLGELLNPDTSNNHVTVFKT